MQKTKYFICFYRTVLFTVPKDVRLNSIQFLITKINNIIELKNIAINHSADIDYQSLKKNYRECTKEPFNFLTR